MKLNFFPLFSCAIYSEHRPFYSSLRNIYREVGHHCVTTAARPTYAAAHIVATPPVSYFLDGLHRNAQRGYALRWHTFIWYVRQFVSTIPIIIRTYYGWETTATLGKLRWDKRSFKITLIAYIVANPFLRLWQNSLLIFAAHNMVNSFPFRQQKSSMQHTYLFPSLFDMSINWNGVYLFSTTSPFDCRGTACLLHTKSKTYFLSFL